MIYLKFGIWLCAVFFLTGCTGAISFTEEALVTPTLIETIQLEDDSGNKLGYATPLRSGVLVGPDHLWQEAGALFYQNQPIEVLARDFRHDIFFFRVPGMAFASTPHWSTQPPGVGQILQWGSGDDLTQAPIYSAKAELGLGNFSVENLMLVDTVLTPGDSGQPLWDASTGTVYGVLVATNNLEKVSYLVRSDLILTLAEEYLD